MRLSGTLRSWNDDRGYGFIAPTHGGAELFVHISELPRDGSRPTVGEKVTYELGRGKNGKPQATRVQREAIGHWVGKPRPTNRERRGSSSFGTKVVGLLLLGGLGAYGFNAYKSSAARYRTNAESLVSQPTSVTAPAAELSSFRCDGRTHCSQMTSCKGAKFFLKNCPGTQMDGNNDGTPCEQQWCTSPFAN
jgi:cold shock CspA family protein